MTRGTEYERAKKARQRQRRKAGEWFATVDVDRGILECCILHDWLDARELGNAEAIKGAIRLLVDR